MKIEKISTKRGGILLKVEASSKEEIEELCASIAGVKDVASVSWYYDKLPVALKRDL